MNCLAKSTGFFSKSEFLPHSNESMLAVKCGTTSSLACTDSFVPHVEKRICKRSTSSKRILQKQNFLRISNPIDSHFKRVECRRISATWEWDNQEVAKNSINEFRKSFNFNLTDMYGEDIPTQGEAVVSGVKSSVIQEYNKPLDLDYLQELLAIQQSGPKAIGFFGTRNMGFMHQQLIEILSYAMVITNNHIFTSGASGTNAAVIRGSLRGERPDLLTVILPQSLSKQPPESQELLEKVANVVEKPHNDCLPLIEASRLCNLDILSNVEQVICFAFHDSKLLMETCREAKEMRKIVTLFYLD